MDYSILLIFGTVFDHITPNVLQTFKVNGSKVKVTAWCSDGENVLN